MASGTSGAEVRMDNATNQERLSTGISVSVYRDGPMRTHVVPYKSEGAFTGEDLCHKMCDMCEIGPAAAPLFGLASMAPDGHTQMTWLSPNAILRQNPEMKPPEFVFRLRFKVAWEPATASDNRQIKLDDLMGINQQAFQYIFYQFRYDFINTMLLGHLTDPTDADKKLRILPWCVGLALLDMTRIAAKEPGLDEKGLREKYPLHHLLSGKVLEKSYKKVKGRILKWKLETDFWSAFGKREKERDTDAVQLTYILQILDRFPLYMIEEYRTTKGEKIVLDLMQGQQPVMKIIEGTSPVVVNGQVVPYQNMGQEVIREVIYIDSIETGLCVTESVHQSGSVRKVFDRPASVSLSAGSGQPLIADDPKRIEPTDNSDDEDEEYASEWTIHVVVSYKPPLRFTFASREEAESCASCIMGYYRQSVNWLINLSPTETLQYPSLHLLRKFQSFGPISHERVSQQLRKQSDNSFIIKLSRHSFDSYRIFYQAKGKRKMYRIDVIRQNGQFQVDGKPEVNYPSISEIVKKVCSPAVMKCIHPIQDRADMTDILFCNADSVSIKAENREIVQKAPNPVLLLSHVHCETNIVLGRGSFTETVACQFLNREGKYESGAVKRLLHKPLLKWFQQGIHRASFWNSAYFVQIKAICLSPFRVVMEKMDHSLTSYLNRFGHSHHEDVFLFDMVNVTTQISSALSWLKGRWETTNDGLYVHGNILSRNVMLIRPSEKVLIAKLADPGIADLFRDEDVDHQQNIQLYRKRLPWVAPECYSPTVGKATNLSDMFSFGVTMWEMFSCGEEPLRGKSDQEVRSFFSDSRSNRLDLPRLLASRDIDPDNKKRAKDAVRDKMYACMSVFPESRPTPEDMLKYMRGAMFELEPNKYEPMNDRRADKVDVPPLDEICLPILPSEENIIPETRIRLTGITLGEGHYGRVEKAVYLPPVGPEQDVAIKAIKDSEKYLAELEKEIKIMKRFRHENVVRALGSCPMGNSNTIHLVMEYVPNCLKAVVESENIPETQMLKFCVDIAKAMVYIENQRVVHRDLAARNVLVTDQMVAKVTDFGLSRIMEDLYHAEFVYKIKSERPMPLLWSAPEGVDRFAHKASLQMSSKSDVWSYGVTIWEIFSRGKKPLLPQLTDRNFKSDVFLSFIRSGSRLARPGFCNRDVYDNVMQKCWQYKPAERPNFKEVLSAVQNILVDRCPVEVPVLPTPQPDAESQLNNELPLPGQTEAVMPSVAGQPRGLPLTPSERNVIKADHLKIENELGDGAFGKVYRAQHSPSGQRAKTVAVKTIKNTNDDCLVEFEKEIKIMFLLKHKNIVQIYGKCFGNRNSEMWLVMEYVPMCLDNLLKKNTINDRRQLLDICTDICEGMQYLETQHVLHRDLASRNVLVENPASPDRHAKITDFGLSRVMEDKYRLNYAYNVTTSVRLHPLWAPPEMYPEDGSLPKNLTSKFDVWSFGVTMWEVFSAGRYPKLDSCSRMPLETKEEQWEFSQAHVTRIRSGETLPEPVNGPFVYRIMSDCWKRKPAERPTFSKLINDLQEVSDMLDR